MKTMNHRLNIVTAALAMLFAASAPEALAAPTYVTNGGAGGVQATIDDSGAFDPSASIGLRYRGREFVNIDNKSSWYWLSAGATSLLAHDGTNPFGATTASAAGGKASTTFSFGGWSFSQLVTAVAPDKLTVSVSLTNRTGATVDGVLWGVGFDPDQDGSWRNVTRNTIVGVGADAAVEARGPISGYSVTLANDTSAGASLIAPYVHVGDCCSPVDPHIPFISSQPVGFTTLADDSISLAYNLGDVAHGETVTFGYSYKFVAHVPELGSQALMLAGLSVMGLLVRRQRVM